MKKKLIQILMLLVATVSVGAFVSCKDTNEDLYNELRTKDLENASVAEALAARIDALETLVANIKSCECDTVKMLGWVNSEDAWLQAQIGALDAALDALKNSTYTKDEVDDLLADLADQYAALADFVALKKDFDTYVVNNNADVRVLQDKVKELQDALKDIVSCKCDLEKLGILEGRIIEAEANAKEALDGLKDIEKIANAAQTAADKAQAAADKAQKTADDATTLAQSANTTAAEAKALADACKTLLDTAVKTATEAKTIATEAKTMAENNKERIEKLEKDLQTLDSKINVVSETANQAVKDAAAAAAKADANKALIDKLTERVTTNETNIATNKANIEALQKSVEKLQDLAEKVGANTEAIKTLKDDVKSLNTKYDEMSTTLAALQQQVTDCQTICKTNLELTKAELRAEIQDLETQLLKDIAVNNQAIEDLRKQHESDVEWIKEALRQISDKANGFVTQTELTDALKPITDKLTELETKDTDLQTQLNTLNDKVIKDLEPRVETLETNVKDLTDRVKAAEDKVDALANQVAEFKTTLKGLQDYLGRLVTGITIQGTQNLMFGSFSIPGIEPYVLVAYYGTPAAGGSFPTSMTGHYIRAEEVLTDKDMEMLSISGGVPEFKYYANLPLVNGDAKGKAYAGKVYMTINPTSANFDDLTLSIRNTKDEESVFELENVHHSQATLQWGYTRATGTNGFYEADAYVKKGALDGVERPFDEAAIKDLAKEAKDQFKAILENKLAPGHTGLDELAGDVYDVIRTLRLEKSGLKCEYTGLDGTPEAVYSQYNLAATALKPISLGFGKDFDFVTVPGYERAENMLATLKNKLLNVTTVLHKGAVNTLITDLENLNIKEVTLEELSDELIGHFKITIDPTFTFEGIRYDLVMPIDVDVPVKYAKGLKVGGTTLTIPTDNVADLTYFEDNIASNKKNAAFETLKSQITKPTIVVINNDAGDLTTALVVPVNDQTGTIQGFTRFPMELPTELTAGNVINISSIPVAQVTGTTLSTAGYTPQTTRINELYYSFDIQAQTFTYTKTIDLTEDIKKIWGIPENEGDPATGLAEAIGDVNDIIKQINKVLKDALDLKDMIFDYETKYNNLVEDYFGTKGKLHNYLEKINKAIVNFVNGINYQLGPYMVTEDAKGFKVISAVKSVPTPMTKNQLKIYPTSKTLEIIVPFARKHVAVTNVFKGAASAQDGDLDCQAKLKAANNNADMNKVIDGTQRMIDVNGLESGYIYEIAYSALDFNGNISTRRGYIQIQ